MATLRFESSTCSAKRSQSILKLKIEFDLSLSSGVGKIRVSQCPSYHQRQPLSVAVVDLQLCQVSSVHYCCDAIYNSQLYPPSSYTDDACILLPPTLCLGRMWSLRRSCVRYLIYIFKPINTRHAQLNAFARVQGVSFSLKSR